MIKKIALTLCVLILIAGGIFETKFLLTGTKTEGVITALKPGKKNTILADIKFKVVNGGELTGVVNSEGHQPGDKIDLIYYDKDPQGTVSAYSRASFAVPVIIFLASGGLLFLIWGIMK